MQTDAGPGALADGAAEALEVGCCAEGELVFVVALDLFEFGYQGWVILVETAEEDERFHGFGVFALLDKEPWRFWQDHHAEALRLLLDGVVCARMAHTYQDQRPGELDSEWDAVTATVVAVFGGCDLLLVLHDTLRRVCIP